MSDPAPALTAEQVSLVLRRAAELERPAQPSEALTTTAEIESIADEVGLSREAVGRALAEVRAGAVVPAERPGTLDRLFGRADVVIERVVPGEAGAVQARLERFLGSQLLRVRRRVGASISWEHARGVLPGLRRSLDLSQRFVFPREAELDTLVLAVPGEATPETKSVPKVLVRIGLHLGAERSRRLSRAAMGIFTGAGLATLGLLSHAVPTEALLMLAGSGTAAGTTLRSRRLYRRDLTMASDAVERFLDELG